MWDFSSMSEVQYLHGKDGIAFTLTDSFVCEHMYIGLSLLYMCSACTC